MGVTKKISNNGMDEIRRHEEATLSFDDVPSSNLTIDSSLSLPDVTPRIVELCKDLFKKWTKLDDNCFLVQPVSGGITNLLLKVSVKEGDGNEVFMTVRLYGPNTDFCVH